MLTLLINETKPLAGLFASSTGGIGSVPDISVADEGQAVSVQTFTRTAGVITDSFVAGDVLHIGIGDGVNAPVCYIELSSASPATGTMAINTVGMVALFAATVANRLSLQVGVVRTRGAYTNTIFSAPIVIHRSVIDPDTAVPTPSILGAGVAAALLVAINTALGFVRLDASARLPAVDGSQLTNLPGGVTDGDKGEITVSNSGATWTIDNDTITLAKLAHMPTARVLGRTTAGTGTPELLTISGTGSVAMTTSPTFATPNLDTPSVLVGTNISGTAANLTAGLVTSIGSLTGDVTSSNRATTLATVNSNVGAFTNASLTVNAKGLVTAVSSGTAAVTSVTGTANQITVTGTTTPTLSLPSALTFTGKTVTGGTFNGAAFNGSLGATTPSTVAGTTGTFSGAVSTTGNADSIFTGGALSSIFTLGESGSILTMGASGYIETRSTYKLNSGSFITTLSHAPTADRAIALPNAAGTLALVSGNLGTPSALVGTNISGTASGLTAGTVTTNANLTGHVTSTGNAAVLGSFTMAQLSTAVSDGDPAYVGAANTFTTGQIISSTTSLLLGTAGSAVGNVGFRNATSGTTTLAPATGALGTQTVTLPLSGTLATLDGAETFTGAKTFSTNPVRLSGNQSAAAWTTTGTGLVQAAASYTDTSSSGTVAVTAINNLAAPTLLASSATTYTDSFVTRMAGPPVASTNVTQTRAHTLGILDSTSASSATTGGLVVSAAFGTAATSVGIGGGTVFVGAQIYLNSTSNWLLTGGNGEMALINSVCDLRIGGNINALWAFNDNTRDLGGSAKQWRSLYIGTSIVNSGTLAVTGATTLTGLLTANGGITLGDAQNIAFNATTGTKIGTATTQKLSFWNATPIVQPTTAVASATFASPGAGTNIKTDDTFDGYTIAQVVKALRNAGLLA